MPMETSHIWVAHFPSEKYLDEYFEEIYDEEDEDTPINRFAEDQGESFYDHDWVERSFCDSGDLKDLIINHSYAEDYIEKVIEIANANNLSGVNTFIMADKEEFSSPKSVDGDKYTIWYLGEFECNV